MKNQEPNKQRYPEEWTIYLTTTPDSVEGALRVGEHTWGMSCGRDADDKLPTTHSARERVLTHLKNTAHAIKALGADYVLMVDGYRLGEYKDIDPDNLPLDYYTKFPDMSEAPDLPIIEINND